MFWTVPDVLDANSLEFVQTSLDKLDWNDGVSTAGSRAKAVKQNEQADCNSPLGRTVTDQIMKAIKAHAVVKAAARPHKFSNMLISRTSGGGQYGPHIDNAIMAGGTLRSDLSFTLFLSDEQSYSGGALCLDLPGGTQEIKLPAGSLVLYATTALHWVEPVLEGDRHAAVGWIQSLVPDAHEREILFDLEMARSDLRRREAGGSAALLTLDKVYSNLLRKWSRLS
ncbi:MAG: Fe2+-dependent dioxygenase [Pseudomonadota bacterium]